MTTEKHEMTLKTTYSSGNQVWVCDTCGRRIMFAVDPTDMIIIEEGNNKVIHFGGTKGLSVGTVFVDQDS